MNEQADFDECGDFKDFTTVNIDIVKRPVKVKPAPKQAPAPAAGYAAALYGGRVLWPMGIGAISVAFGAMSLLQMIGRMLNLGFMIIAYGRSPFFLLGWTLSWMIETGTFLLQGVIGGLVLAAGLLLMRQSRSAPGMHKAYAILAIILNLIVVLARCFTYWDPRWSMLRWLIWPAIMGMIFPVFLLIWFRRPRVKREVARWRKPASPAGACVTGVGERRMLWPVAIGAMSIALAAWGMLSSVGFTVLGIGIQIVEDGGSSLGEIFGGNLWGSITGIVYLLTGIIDALLLPAGLLVWRQSRLGLRMHKAYAILAILLHIARPLAQIFTYPEELRMLLLFSPIWLATMGMVYPVFLLIWFARSKVKAETRLWR